jgi:dynamin-like GTPase MGM1, mitochondrial
VVSGEWGEFTHKPNEKFWEESAIQQEIEQEANRIGRTYQIRNTCVQLKFYSSRVPNLTIVELPGLCEHARYACAPPDYVTYHFELAREYLSNPNAVILCLCTAISDVANSLSLSLVKEVDPQGRKNSTFI